MAGEQIEASTELPRRRGKAAATLQLERAILEKWFAKNTTADPRKCWELDAMDPNDLRVRVREEIESLMDFDAWDRGLRIEAKERESMEDFHAAWTNRLRGASHA